jgi:hypothetical protein
MAGRSSPCDFEPTLCFPDEKKSCFACCPPLRPAGYEHIQHRTIIQRMLRENTKAFDRQDRHFRPITGFSCWALGYLDDGCRLMGCLLHPERHQGKDFRFLTDYGEKCRRENCPESKVFLALSIEARRFWLHLAEGLSAFQYSSRRFNPLFHLLGWGSALLGAVAVKEKGEPLSPHHLSKTYPVLQSGVDPRACAYLLKSIALQKGIASVAGTLFAGQFAQFSSRIMPRLRDAPLREGAPFTHLLALDPLFLNLLRLGGGIKRIHEDVAVTLKTQVDEALSHFISQMEEKLSG